MRLTFEYPIEIEFVDKVHYTYFNRNIFTVVVFQRYKCQTVYFCWDRNVDDTVSDNFVHKIVIVYSMIQISLNSYNYSMVHCQLINFGSITV